ncbi:hypothetical protein [Burkholderia cepacia]|uniref:hypothetical protein n=1 Tax=Burkholderia cepacia TaxID=292 RepID=UPI002FE343DC
MIAAFEGLPYAGKSTLLRDAVTLLPRDRSVHCISETVLPALARFESFELRQAGLESYQENDWLKSSLCESASTDSIILMDRYFFSTIVCDLALNGFHGRSEMIERMCFYRGAVLPDIILYVDTSIETIQTRAQEDSRRRLVGPWSGDLRIIERLYDMMLTLIENNFLAKVYRLRTAADLAAPLSEIQSHAIRRYSQMSRSEQSCRA